MASRILAEKIGVWKVDGTYHETYDAARKALIAKLVYERVEAQYGPRHQWGEDIAASLANDIDAILSEAKEALDKVPAASAANREPGA